MCFWTKDTRSCSSQGQSDYLRSSFSTEKEYSNLSSKIRKVDCNTNSTMVFNLGSLLPVTRALLVSCASPGVGKMSGKTGKKLSCTSRQKSTLYLKFFISFRHAGFVCTKKITRRIKKPRTTSHLCIATSIFIRINQKDVKFHSS